MAVQIDGINVHIDSRNSSLVRKLGCQWVRIDVNWWQIEKSRGSYSWSAIDSIVNSYRSAGMMIYATLMGTPSWLGKDFRSPPDVASWRSFCIAFAKRYVGKVQVVSLWNEPNLGKTFWTGKKKQFFETIVKNGYQAIKAVNPNILVAASDFATLGSSHWTTWLNLMKKYRKYIDILSVHAYGSSASKILRCWNSGKFWFFGWLIPKWRPYKWYFNAVRKPIYLTEIGFPAKYGNSKEMKKQKEFTEKIMKNKKDLKNVHFIFFYCLIDADPKLEKPFGFYSSNGQPKTVSC